MATFLILNVRYWASASHKADRDHRHQVDRVPVAALLELGRNFSRSRGRRRQVVRIHRYFLPRPPGSRSASHWRKSNSSSVHSHI